MNNNNIKPETALLDGFIIKMKNRHEEARQDKLTAPTKEMWNYHLGIQAEIKCFIMELNFLRNRIQNCKKI